jgi:hypothetical protein
MRVIRIIINMTRANKAKVNVNNGNGKNNIIVKNKAKANGNNGNGKY